MKFIKMLGIVIILGLSACDSKAKLDKCNYGKERAESIICYGPAVLNGTTVSGAINVVGPFTARKVVAKSLTVTGTADLQDTQIANLVKITGVLQAQSSHLHKDVSVQSDSVILNKTIISGNVDINSTATKPYLRLECGSSIAGQVTFSGMAGIVQVSDDSTFNGKINNGQLEFIRINCQ